MLKEFQEFALKGNMVDLAVGVIIGAAFGGHGDLVIVTAGTPFGVPRTTNLMIVESIGDVLVRGFTGYGERVHGNVILVLHPESVKWYEVRDQIIVLTQCNESYLPLIKESSGVILQNHIDDSASEQYVMEIAKVLEKPVIIRADASFGNLKEGQLVTLDPERALVYKGVVF